MLLSLIAQVLLLLLAYGAVLQSGIRVSSAS